MTEHIRVGVIDDHAVVREGLALYLERFSSRVRVVAEAGDPGAFLSLAAQVDVVLLDLRLREGPSLDAIPGLVHTGAPVLLYTVEERPVPLRAAVERGVAGVLLKNDPIKTVVEGIERAVAGEFYCSGPLAHALLDDSTRVAELSPRQQRVLRCLDEGLDYRATARVLGITPEGTRRTSARPAARIAILERAGWR